MNQTYATSVPHEDEDMLNCGVVDGQRHKSAVAQSEYGTGKVR